MPSTYLTNPLTPRTGASYSGGTHFQFGKNSNPIRNNGGTVFNGGSIGITEPFNQEALTTPAITQSIGWPNMGFRSGFSETPPVLSAWSAGIVKGLTSGSFATMTPGHYIVFGLGGVAGGFLAGLTNNVLTFTGNPGQHPWRNAFGPYIRTWNRITLTPNGGAPNGWSYVTGFLVNPNVNSADLMNVETNPGSYAIPGDIIFLSTGKSLTTKVLPNKTD